MRGAQTRDWLSGATASSIAPRVAVLCLPPSARDPSRSCRRFRRAGEGRRDSRASPPAEGPSPKGWSTFAYAAKHLASGETDDPLGHGEGPAQPDPLSGIPAAPPPAAFRPRADRRTSPSSSLVGPAGRTFLYAASSGRPHPARGEGPYVYEAVGPVSEEGERGSGHYPGPSASPDSSRATSSRMGQTSGRPSASHTPEPGSAVPIWAAAWPC